MKSLLLKIEDLKNQINQLPPISEKDQERLWEKFRLEWNYNSNHLEGNTLTLAQTKTLLHFGDEAKMKEVSNVTLREIKEMEGHDFAIKHLDQFIQDQSRPLTQSDICELNQTILVKPFWKDAETPMGDGTRKQIMPGQYKEQPNHVRLPNGKIFKYTEPEFVPAEMTELLDWYRNETKLNVIEKAALFHYKFVIIHPFDDGNGRVSRLLMNYHLMKNGFPPVIIKSEDKKNYVYALGQADNADLDSFIKYIANQLLWSLEISLKATKGEDIEEAADFEKKIDLYIKKLDSQKPTTPKRNNKVCIELYELSIEKLFGHILSNLMKISNIFVEAKFPRFFNMKNSDYINEENILRFKKDGNNDHLTKFILAIYYSGIEKGQTKKQISIERNVTVDLNLYTYEIKLSGDRKIENNYSELLSIHEMNLIADDVKRRIFSMIEKHG